MAKMNVIEAIQKRRSIRKYQLTPIPEEVVRELLEAARLAPSGCNAQPWKYIILEKEEIAKLKEQKIFWQDWVYSSPLILICLSEPSAYKANRETIESQIEEGIQPKGSDKNIDKMYKGKEIERAARDCAISMAYLGLRATELGLGTCYVGCFDRDKLKQFFNLSNKYEPVCSICIGYPAESPKQRPRKPLEEMIYKTIETSLL